MKSEHRHELETNALAVRVSDFLDRVQPYNSLIVGGLLALAVLFFAYSYFSSETVARQSAAWNSYNSAVEGMLPDLTTLRQSAEEYPDSPMQQWADITWADGQVWMASRAFIQNRSAALEALSRAEGTYQSLLKESNDVQMQGRAHFGLGRAHEIRGDVDKAKTEYLATKGAFAKLAEQRAKQLEEPEAKEVYAWLATAEAPRRAPTGGGIPGNRPGFAPGDLDLPTAGTTTTDPGAAMTVEDLFKGIGETGDKDDPSVTDRYDGEKAATESATGDADANE
jgi:hypothetical protein